MKELLELHPAMSYKVTNWSPAGLACPFPGYDGILGCSWMMSNHYPTALPAICRCHRSSCCGAAAIDAVLLPSCQAANNAMLSLHRQAVHCHQRRTLVKLPLPPRCHRASAATTIAFVSMVSVVTVIVVVSVAIADTAFN